MDIGRNCSGRGFSGQFGLLGDTADLSIRLSCPPVIVVQIQAGLQDDHILLLSLGQLLDVVQSGRIGCRTLKVNISVMVVDGKKSLSRKDRLVLW